MRTMVLEYESLHDWAIFGVNLVKYAIHWASGMENMENKGWPRFNLAMENMENMENM